MKKAFLFIWHIPRNLVIGLILVYQKLLSPDHSFWAKAVHIQGYCKYHPTCSEYAKQTFRKHGFMKGFLKGGYRVLRCNPWSDGGIDMP